MLMKLLLTDVPKMYHTSNNIILTIFIHIFFVINRKCSTV